MRKATSAAATTTCQQVSYSIFTKLLLWVFVFFGSFSVNAQAPSINYGVGPQSYGIGSAISPLTPVNSGGPVAPVSLQVTTLASGFNNPTAIAIDAFGNAIFSDRDNRKIKKVTPAGVVTTIAGSGGAGTVDNANPLLATFDNNYGIALDASGNIYVTEFSGKLRRIDGVTGAVTTIVNSGLGQAWGLALDPSGTSAYVACNGNNAIKQVTLPGGVVTIFAGAPFPSALGIDPFGFLYMSSNNGIQKFIAGVPQAPLISGNDFRSFGFDPSGNLYFEHVSQDYIGKITQGGIITTYAGVPGTPGYQNGPALSARFNLNNSGVAGNASGDVLVADPGNGRIRKIALSSYSVSPDLPNGLTLDGGTGIISGTPTTATPSAVYTITAFNASGSSTTTLTIAVVNCTSPTFSACPANQTANTAINTCAATVTYTATATGTTPLTVAYAFTGATTGSGSGTGSGSFFNKGTTTVTATATNGCGTVTCTFTVTVVDIQPPTITCAGPVTINTTAGMCTGTTILIPPIVTDNCMAGTSGNALKFDGLNDYVSISNPVGSVFTIEAWIKTSANSFNGTYAYQGNGIVWSDVSSGANDFTIAILNNKLSFFDGSVNIPTNGTTILNNNAWHHIAVIRNGAAGTTTLYVDGILNGSNTCNNVPLNANPNIAIGGNTLDGRYFNGLIDEVRIWNVARTQAQIRANMNSELSAETGLVRAYHFNQGIAGGNNAGLTTAINASGGTNNGTLNNFALTGLTSNWVDGIIPGTPTVFNNAPPFFQIGNTTVTWTATDAGGNTATCDQVVTVVDNQAPVITCSGPGINISKGISSGGTARIVGYESLYGAYNYTGTNLGSSCNEAWTPFGTLCDEAPNTDSPAASTKTTNNSGATWGWGDEGEDVGVAVGVLVIDLGSVKTFSRAQVFQMFSDGQVTSIQGFYHPSTSASPPAYDAAGWVQMFAETSVGDGVLTGNTVTSPTTINFGQTNARYVRYYVRNDGSLGSEGWIELRSVKLFNPSSGITATLPPGQCSMPVNFSVPVTDNCPGTVVTYSPASGSLFYAGITPVTVTATDASGNAATCTFNVTVIAPAVAPEINVKGNAITIVDGDATPTAADGTDFGQPFPAIPVTHTFTISNNGTAPLAISSLSISGTDPSSFTIGGISTPITLASAGSTSFTVTFAATPLGNYNAILNINNNDCDEALYDFALHAEVNCQPAAFIACPGNQAANTAPNTCAAVLNYTATVIGAPAPTLTYAFTGTTTGSGSGTGSGASFNKGTSTVTITATNGCGSATCTFTVTVNDNQPPVITCPPPLAVPCASAVPVPNIASVSASDNCPGVQVSWVSDIITPGDCPNQFTITRTYRATDVSNNTATCTQTITVFDDAPPTINCPPSVTVQCSGDVPLPTPATVTASDNCGAVTVTWEGDVISDQTCANRYTITRTYKATDACGNSATCTQTITVFDNTPPTITCPANKIIPFNGACTYNANPTITGNPTSVTDNCGGTVVVTYTDVVSQCGYNTVITRSWKATDVCGNSATCEQMITATDNNTPYIIYATKEAKFGEDNIINGDVGVTDANGKAEFRKNDVLDPNTVRAKNITVQLPSSVNNKVFSPATGGPNPTFLFYVANPLSGNYTQSVNGVVPAGNYKNLTIRKGVTATVNGSNYGKISIEEGCNVTFTSSDINIEELTVSKGKNNGTTNVYFSTCAAVKVRQKVTIEEDCRVNVGGPKVTFYLGDAKKDEENFMVKGDDTQVTLNIMIPNGKLKIDKKTDNCIMTGWFIIEKLESTGATTWNKYGCAPIASRTIEPVFTELKPMAPEITAPVETFQVKVYPNPSATDFSIRVMSSSNEPIVVRVLDVTGTVLKVSSNVVKGSVVRLGTELRGGTYLAEVTQGANKQVVKLVKLN